MTTTSLGRKAIRTAALAAGLAIAPLLALAQDFPQRPLTLVVPYPAGGATDTLARILSKSMAAKLGQPVIVENKAGAGTTIGAAAVA
ncbi:MAG: tripartite tricarboxylate transporter substrate binding protein, partial [Rhodoferax sp.]|nr:tripartite tricarboxylate transporter substrate binding protein [Rhodoferax sp.]